MIYDVFSDRYLSFVHPTLFELPLFIEMIIKEFSNPVPEGVDFLWRAFSPDGTFNSFPEPSQLSRTHFMITPMLKLLFDEEPNYYTGVTHPWRTSSKTHNDAIWEGFLFKIADEAAKNLELEVQGINARSFSTYWMGDDEHQHHTTTSLKRVIKEYFPEDRSDWLTIIVNRLCL